MIFILEKHNSSLKRSVIYATSSKVKTQQRKMKKEKSENDVVDIDLLLTAIDQV